MQDSLLRQPTVAVPALAHVAFFADYESGEIRIDGAEIEDAQWFGIENLENLPRLPARISIARRLIDAAIGEMRAV